MEKYLVGQNERVQLTEELKRARVTLGSSERVKQILHRLDELDRWEECAKEIMARKNARHC